MSSIFHSIKIIYRYAPFYSISRIMLGCIDTLSVFIVAKVNELFYNELSILLTGQNNTNKVFIYTVATVIIGFIFGIIRLPINYYASLSIIKYNDYITQRTLDAAEKLDFSFFNEPDKQNKHKQYISDIAAILNTYTSATDLLTSVISLGVSLYICYQFNPIITLLTLIITIPTFIIRKKIRNDNYELEKKLNMTNRKIGYYKSLFTEKNFYLESHLYDYFHYFKKLLYNENLERYSMHRALRSKEIKRELCIFAILTLANFIINIYIIYVVILSGMLIGSYTYYITILNNLKSSVDKSSDLLNSMLMNCKKMDNALNFEQSLDDLPDGNVELYDSIKQIRFENVSFKYPNTDVYALNNVSLTINEGQKVALAGLNGAGKSTFILLLLRYYHPLEGQIFVNNIDIREYTIRSLRAQFSTMFQLPHLYNITLEDNIRISDLSKNSSSEHIFELLNKVGLYTGNDSSIIKAQMTKTFSDDGIVPSVGQVQRINLAKTIHRNASVRIFDEPLSSLDALSEEMVFRKICNESKDKIVILISHKLYHLKDFDTIYYLANGSIVEYGKHSDLINLRGEYSYLYEMQYRKYI